MKCFFSLVKSPNNSNSPCHACGMVKGKSRVGNSRGQKSRCPLTSKYGEGFTDASTQTYKVDVSTCILNMEKP